MKYTRRVSHYSLGLLVFSLHCSLNAAQPIFLQGASIVELQEFQIMIPGVPFAVNDSQNALKFIQKRVDENKIRHVRMQQTYEGFPVFRGYAIVHSVKAVKTLLNDPNQMSMNGVIYKGLDKDLAKPSPFFLKKAEIALQNFQAQYPKETISEAKVMPMVYIDDENKAVWAYEVSMLVHQQGAIPARPTAILNAENEGVILQWNDIKTAYHEVHGVGFGGNERMGKLEYGRDRPSLKITRDDKAGLCYLENLWVKVVDMGRSTRDKKKPMHFNCQKADINRENVYWTGSDVDGYDLENGAYSPSNDAMYTGHVIHEMYKKWYNVEVLSKSGRPRQLVLRVHYGKHYENAFWDGTQMTFGDGGTLLHPLVSLGIGAHEISHGFTDEHSHLMYFGQSGGINEAFSDMAAQTAEFYSEQKNSWLIGANILKASSGYEALRYMETPSRDEVSIDRADQYYPGLDVHYSSGVYNRLFYLLANQPKWDTRKAFKVMVKANMDYWHPYTNFVEGGCGIISAAQDLSFSVEDVKASLDKVAISHQNCISASLKKRKRLAG